MIYCFFIALAKALKFVKRMVGHKPRIVSVAATENALYAVMSDGRVMTKSKKMWHSGWFEHAEFKELRGDGDE